MQSRASVNKDGGKCHMAVVGATLVGRVATRPLDGRGRLARTLGISLS